MMLDWIMLEWSYYSKVKDARIPSGAMYITCLGAMEPPIGSPA